MCRLDTSLPSSKTEVQYTTVQYSSNRIGDETHRQMEIKVSGRKTQMQGYFMLLLGKPIVCLSKYSLKKT